MARLAEQLAQCTPDDLADAIEQMAAVEAGVRRVLLELVVAYDHSEAWRDHGAGRWRPGWRVA